MHQRRRHGDIPGGRAVAGEAKLVVGGTQVGVSGAAARAMPARHDPLGDHPGPRREPRSVRTDHGARPFVPEHQRVPRVGGVELACHQVQVGAAQAHHIRPDEHLPRPRNRCVPLFKHHVAGRPHHQRRAPAATHRSPALPLLVPFRDHDLGGTMGPRKS